MAKLLSILIPTYNYKCYHFVETLKQQADSIEGLDYEILVADDGSRDQVTKIANLRINELEHCRYIYHKENIGRAANRNLLFQEASGTWCLLMDCDARVVTDDFIQAYIDAMQLDKDVVVGKLVNPETLPSPDVTLRYFYEKSAEYQRPADFRNNHPYERFTTFNFMARRDVLLRYPFDKKCTDYGFEDTLMGVVFKQNNVSIAHIDNPLMHIGFESNAVYLRKVETALRTLCKLGEPMESNSGVGRFAQKLSSCHVLWIARLVYAATRSLLRRNLLSCHPNMMCFAFYKLGYYLSLKSE